MSAQNVYLAEILIVEDDPQVGAGLQMYLESNDYEVTLVNNGQEGLREALRIPAYDLVILDARLPLKSGFDILREMRSQGANAPVLMLTGLGSHEDRMRGFDLGADDYLTKPFASEELLLRVQVILKRSRKAIEDAKGVYEAGGLRIDIGERLISRDGEKVELTDLEFRLLRYLIVHRDRTVSRKQLLRDVWSLPAQVETRTIDRHVNALRRLMDGTDEATWPIQSVYGIGYKLVGAQVV